MLELILAVLAFLASHAVPAVKPVRAALTARFGERAYLILYSLASLAVLVLARRRLCPRALYRGLAVRPVDPLGAGAGHAASACILLVAASDVGQSLLHRNRPPSLRSGTAGDRLGHPASADLGPRICGRAAHLVPNGDAASIILFGVLLFLSLLGPLSLDAKRKAQWGAGGMEPAGRRDLQPSALRRCWPGAPAWIWPESVLGG